MHSFIHACFFQAQARDERGVGVTGAPRSAHVCLRLPEKLKKIKPVLQATLHFKD